MNIYIVAGANGSGKTTFAREFLSTYAHCPYFINADNIAQGLSPFSPALVAIKAGKILLSEIKELTKLKKTFAFETTLSGKTYISFIKYAKSLGYKIHIFYLWVPNPDFASTRVKFRVARGGHNIPINDIKRRYHRSLRNFFTYYSPLVNSWNFFDNSSESPVLMANGSKNTEVVYEKVKFQKIKDIISK